MTDIPFWEWFGYREKYDYDAEEYYVYDPTGRMINSPDFPEINLKNLLTICVPELQKRGYVISIVGWENGNIQLPFHVQILKPEYIDGSMERLARVSEADGKDLAQVLRQAIEKVVEND